MLMASGVNLSDTLKRPTRVLDERAQGNLAATLGDRQAAARMSQGVAGRPQGTYQDERMAQAGMMAGRGVEDSLYGVLGGASYRDAQSQQEYDRQMELAKQIGDLNKYSALQQTVGGIGMAAKAAPAFKSIYDSFQSPQQPVYQDTSPELNYYNPGSSGYARYQYG